MGAVPERFAYFSLFLGAIVSHQQIHAGAVALHAQLLTVALEEAVIDGLGRLVHRSLELLPVGVVGGKIRPNPGIQGAVDLLPCDAVGFVKGVAQMDIAQEGGGVAVDGIATF